MPIYIKKKIYRVWLRIKNSFNNKEFMPQIPMTETQELAIRIFERSIANPESDLLMAPLSLTYYVHTKDIFIIVGMNEMRIINGRYEYHIILNDKIFEKLTYKFKRVLENRRKKMEKEMLTNTKKSLENILSDLA